MYYSPIDTSILKFPHAQLNFKVRESHIEKSSALSKGLDPHDSLYPKKPKAPI